MKLLKKDAILFKFSLYSLLLGLVFAAFAPPEKTIGKVISLVYLHIGFFAGAIILLFLSAANGLLCLLWKKKSCEKTTEVFFKVAFLGWLIYFVLSAAIAYLSWGAVFWEEPRMVIAVKVLFIFVIAFLLDWFLEKRFRTQVFTGASALSILLWMSRYSIIHPEAPIRKSDVAAIKLTAYASVFLIALSIITLAISVAGRELRDGAV